MKNRARRAAVVAVIFCAIGVVVQFFDRQRITGLYLNAIGMFFVGVSFICGSIEESW